MIVKNLYKNVSKFACLFLTAIFFINCFADTQTLTTPTFTINLPQDMEQIMHVEDSKFTIYQYVFSTMPDTHSSPRQLRITVIGKAPTNTSDYPAWELKILGSMIGLFTGAYHLKLSDQSEALNKKPETVVLGNQTFSTTTMTFNNNMEVRFFTTVAKNLTYMFTLVSVDNDTTKRNANMAILIDALKTLKTS